MLRAAAVASAACAAAGAVVRHDDPFVQYVGRFAHEADRARYDAPGCEIRVRVDGARRVALRLAQAMGVLGNSAGDADEVQRNEFAVFVDGVLQRPLRGQCLVDNGRQCTFDTFGAGNGTVDEYVVAADLRPGAAHDVRVVKTTEAQWSDRSEQPNWVSFHGFVLDDGRAVAPVVPLPLRRIEFIGDSMSTGYCNTCAGPMGPDGIKLYNLHVDWTADEYWRTQLRTGASGESFLSAWPARTCEALGAQCHTSAWSGLGLTHECCDGGTTMDRVWKRAVSTDPSSSWDFKRWAPDALVMNIGMNDGARVNTPKWQNTYVSLVSNATMAYGAGLHVFLACGPVTSRYCDATQRVVERLQGMGVRAQFLDQRPFLNGTYGGACCGHPGKVAAQAMADSAAATILSSVGWTGWHGDYLLENAGLVSRYECQSLHGDQCASGLLEILSPTPDLEPPLIQPAHTMMMNEI